MFQILATHEQACWNSGEDAGIWHGTEKKTQEWRTWADGTFGVGMLHVICALKAGTGLQ